MSVNGNGRPPRPTFRQLHPVAKVLVSLYACALLLVAFAVLALLGKILWHGFVWAWVRV